MLHAWYHFLNERETSCTGSRDLMHALTLWHVSCSKLRLWKQRWKKTNTEKYRCTNVLFEFLEVVTRLKKFFKMN